MHNAIIHNKAFREIKPKGLQGNNGIISGRYYFCTCCTYKDVILSRPKVAKFEEDIKKYKGADYAAAVNKY